MASTNVYPPPPAPQYPPPYRYRRSIAGPLVLIVIGLVFLLRNFGVRIPIWHWFGHWWPLLLILFGVIRLIEHSMGQRQGYRSGGIGSRDCSAADSHRRRRAVGALQLRH